MKSRMKFVFNAIINFVDYKALADDAENRNRTFMKILGGVGVLSKIW